MGWLRDAWTQAGYGTLEALAKALHEHESWPPGIKSPRTIKNHLGELAKQRGHTWWEHKEGRLDAMAALIAWEPERLKIEIARERRERERPTTEGQTFALAGLGRVRHLDLAVDDLPPGVPELATRPSRWRRHWWACSDLRTLELVGRWLEARGKAVFVIAQSADELCRRLPSEGRVYALLTRAARSDDFEALADRVELDDLSVCVAAPFCWRPPVASKRVSKEPEHAPTRWTAIELTTLSTVMPEVVAWVDSRIQARRRVLDMKRLEFLGGDVDRICAGPCDLVDLLSFVATYVSAKKSTARSKVLQEYLVRRGELTRIRERVGGWLAKDAATTLSEMLNAALLRGVDTWSSGLTRREWAGLAPTRGTSQDDVERVRQRLQSDEATASTEAREELERLLRPAEEQVVDKLADAELLTQTASGCFEISPSWFGQLVYQEAYAGLLARGHGYELGALLLLSSRSEAVLDDMLRRFLAHRSKRLIVSLDETEREPSTPENLAFHEALFRVLGIAALVEDDLPSSLIERVVRLQEKSLVPGPGGVPVPSVSLVANDGGAGLGTDHVFHLAAMSLVERVPESTLADLISTKLLHSASKSLPALAATHPDLVPAAFRLTANLITGPLHLEFAEKELVVPAFVFLLAAESWVPPGGRERVTERILGYLDRHSRPWRLRTGLVALDGFQDVSLEAALRNLWSLWLASPTCNRAPVAWGRHDPETRAWLWSAAGDDQRLAFLELEHVAPQTVDAALAGVFTDEMWEVWLKRWLTSCKGHNEHRDVVGHVFALAPPEIVRAAIRPGGLHAYRTPSSFAELWRSRPDTMLEIVSGDSFERVVHVAVTSPSQRLGEVLERIRGWSEHDKLEPRALSLLVGWLRSQVRMKREQQQELIGLLREFRL